ncbi:hypothetical protein OKA05_04965 [Luteolibacter arcticus]|uniref:AbrB/MazE/SpoVT family DNA-binding domain-containing protein n=1 Tax=Luteolibacter arcticus TaxID=1581411 RepID=A0ABT3GEL4_9BACT|nr:hypothetical protein [Luteolibacter arcticus]MCW1921891.1 hypothetical protein [Luteolibacter arcticus]
MQEFSLNKDGQVVIPATVMKAAAFHDSLKQTLISLGHPTEQVTQLVPQRPRLNE